MRLAPILPAVLACGAAAATTCHAGTVAELSHPDAATWKLYRAPAGCLASKKPEYLCKLTNAANRDQVMSTLKDYTNYQWEQAGDSTILVNCVDCPITQLANTVHTKIETAFDCQFLG